MTWVTVWAPRRAVLLFILLASAMVMSLLNSGSPLPGVSEVRASGHSSFCASGTRFFASAGVGTQFQVGDTWQGGTFTFIENNNYMEVRDNPANNPQGIIVGEFNQPRQNGDEASISFASSILITQILWYDNDPDTTQGETGWSFNGISGPITGHQGVAVTSVNITTTQVQISAGLDSGGVDFCFVPAGGQGCTPGFWKTHSHYGPAAPDAWPTSYDPDQLVSTYFSNANPYHTSTLLQALSFGGGSGVDGAKRILLRAAVASLLNAAHPNVNFGMSEAQVMSQVSAALATGSRSTMLALATQLDAANNQGCPL